MLDENVGAPVAHTHMRIPSKHSVVHCFRFKDSILFLFLFCPHVSMAQEKNLLN